MAGARTGREKSIRQRSRALSNWIFAAGLLLAPLSFLEHLGNALTMEAASHGAAPPAIVEMIGGDILGRMVMNRI